MPEDLSPRLPDSAPPRLPKGPRPQPPPRGENSATFAALAGLGLISVALISMVALVLPQIRGLVLVFFGAVGFFAVHYVVWGWWLPKLVPRDDDST